RAARSTPTSSASSGPSSKAEAAGGSRLRLPDPQQAPQHDDLAEVVRVVVGGEERLAEEGVARRVVELGQEVGLRALDEADEFFHVVEERLHGVAPGGLRGLGVGPVVV